MNKHTESIVVFGLILPGLVLAIALGGVLFGRSKLHSTANQKIEAYREYEQAAAALKVTEREFVSRRESFTYWKENVSKELIQTLSANLRQAMEPYTDDQLRQTELSRPSNSSQFASMTKNRYDRFRLSFEGGFGPMQHVLATLETQMPQIVLETFNVGPSAQSASQGSARRLKFDVTYLSWRKE